MSKVNLSTIIVVVIIVIAGVLTTQYLKDDTKTDTKPPIDSVKIVNLEHKIDSLSKVSKSYDSAISANNNLQEINLNKIKKLAKSYEEIKKSLSDNTVDQLDSIIFSK